MAGEVSKALRILARLPFVFRTSGARLSSFFVLPLNPEVYTLQLPTRGSVTATVNGNFEHFFGAGIGRAVIRGTFGFMPRPQLGLAGVPLPGQLQLKYLETVFNAFYREHQQLIAKNQAAWDFMDLADQHFLKVRIVDFQYERSTAHQFLHRYSIQMHILRDYLAEKVQEALPEDSVMSKLTSPAAALAGIVGAAGNLALGSDAA
ncbi:MAG TPA: hypothetical protein VNN13_09735, partial [Methylomirabilota bacterium]|nr:hypothetical protein [Methylomirabilota bacterium]